MFNIESQTLSLLLQKTNTRIIEIIMITAKDIQKNLGKQIQRIRRKRKLSQEKLAEKIGIATNSLSNIETGNSFMTVYTLEKIINTLEISPKELFDFPEYADNSTDMVQFIIETLETIKKDKEKLSLLYYFTKILS